MDSLFELDRKVLARRRLGGFLVAAVAIAAILLAFRPQAVSAQADEPFTCNEDMYIMQAETDGAGSLSQLYVIDRYDFNNLIEIGNENTRYNAIGYNPQDNYIYGIHDRSSVPGAPLGTVYRIDSDGNTTSLGVPVNGTGIWPLNVQRWNAGTVLPNGNYVVVNDQTPKWIVEIDVTTSPNPTVVNSARIVDFSSRFWDIAYRPQDQTIYGYDIGANDQFQFATLDPSTGAVNHFGVTQNDNNEELRNGSMFFDSVGDVYMYGGDYDGGSNFDQDRFYIGDIDSATAPPLGTYVELAQGEVVVASDGASCPFYVAMRKTVDPLTSFPGGIVTYTYEIGNYLPYDQTAVTFTDIMGDGRTFVAGTLSPASPGGGTANAYAGTDTLQITNMTLPSEQITTFTVEVQVPYDATSGTITNQSELTDLTGIPDIPSDYPLLPGDEDPTPLIIEAGTVYGHIYLDTDGSGGQNGAEPDLPNVDVVITDSQGNVQTVTTDSNGNWTAQVPPGTTVADIDESTLPAGVTQTEGTDPTTVTAVDGSSTDAGNDGFQPGEPTTIGDFVWLDLNGDGIQDSGEPGIEGVTVRLYDPGGDGVPGGGDDTLLDTTSTDASGAYSFTPAAGDYFVEFAYPGAGFSPQDVTNPNGDERDSDANASGQTAVRTFAPGGTDNDVDAGILPAVIGDFVWWDDNADGIQNNGEPGAAGVTVNLYDPGADGQPGGGDDTLLDTTATDGSGAFSFTVAPGDYFVEYITPAGSTFTGKGLGGSDALDSDADPATGYSDVVSLSSSDTDDTIDAGLLLIPLSITLGQFKAERVDDTVQFTWRTDTENGNAGFNIYVEKANGQRTRINDELIESTVIHSILPTNYSYSAVITGDTFYLEMISIRDTKQLFGPFRVDEATLRLPFVVDNAIGAFKARVVIPTQLPGEDEWTADIWLPLLQETD